MPDNKLTCTDEMIEAGRARLAECTNVLLASNEIRAIIEAAYPALLTQLAEVERLLPNVAQMLDEMKTERQHGHGLAWTDWNQEQRDDLSHILSLLRNRP